MPLKSFDTYLNEAVTPDEEKELLKKGQDITEIVNETVSHQNKISELYDKLKELIKDNEVLEPISKAVTAASAKSKEDAKGAEEIKSEIQKNKKEYTPRPGSASEAIINFLEKNGEATEPELLKEFGGGPFAKLPNGNRAWNFATVSTSISFLVEKGKLNKERKRNPKSNRMAYFYSLKK